MMHQDISRLDYPYKGLGRFTYHDAPLYAGRQDEIDECIYQLYSTGPKIFILHGNSGCGKSSFLQAGLVPQLESRLNREGWGIRTVGSHASHRSDADFLIRLQGPRARSPLQSIAAALVQVTKNNPEDCLDGLSPEEFVRHAGTNSDLLLRTLTRFVTPFIARKDTPLFIIDQAEDIFSSGRYYSESECDEYFAFLSQLTVEPIPVTFLISLRSEYKAQLDDALTKRRADYATVSTHYLHEMDDDALLTAILKPTEIAKFGFRFDRDLPSTIIRDLRDAEFSRSGQPLLPILQVVCQRLYFHWKHSPRHNNHIISEADYRAMGAGSTQIQSFIEEAIVGHFLEPIAQQPTEATSAPDSIDEVNFAEQADLWQLLLARMCSVHRDGRISATETFSDDQIKEWAEELCCAHSFEMLHHLARPECCVLEKMSRDPLLVNSSEGWKLSHDTVAAVLNAWSREERTTVARLQLGTNEVRQDSTSFRTPDLYSTPPSSRTFSTLNDLIWDHLILIYAHSRGFCDRLGISLSLDAEFDLSRRKSSGSRFRSHDYYTRFLQHSESQQLLAVLPGNVFPQIETQPWLTIGIPNYYKGYAIVGKLNQTDAVPLERSIDRNDPECVARNRARLSVLAGYLSREGVRIKAYERTSVLFLNVVLSMTEHAPKDTDILTENPEDFQGAQDQMFHALLSHEVDFVLGPAPSRALATQAGFRVLADYDQIYALASTTERKTLQATIIHENLVVNLDLKRDEATVLRLVSVLLYTVQTIREDPEDFVRFVYNQCLKATTDGGYALQRGFIRETIDRCYGFIDVHDYPVAYFLPDSTLAYSKSESTGAAEVFRRWSNCREECDRLISSINASAVAKLSPQMKGMLRFAENHYRILNFYDARQCFAQIVEVVSCQIQND